MNIKLANISTITLVWFIVMRKEARDRGEKEGGRKSESERESESGREGGRESKEG